MCQFLVFAPFMWANTSLLAQYPWKWFWFDGVYAAFGLQKSTIFWKTDIFFVIFLWSNYSILTKKNSSWKICKPRSIRRIFQILSIFYSFGVMRFSFVAFEKNHTVPLVALVIGLDPGGLFRALVIAKNVFNWNLNAIAGRPKICQLLTRTGSLEKMLLISCWKSKSINRQFPQ